LNLNFTQYLQEKKKKKKEKRKKKKSEGESQKGKKNFFPKIENLILN